MAVKRKRIKRFESPGIQGEGSWVKVSQLTVQEMRDNRVRAKAEDFDPFELGVDILQAHVLEWNWVDDDDVLLPQPKDEPEIIGVLTDMETTFLSECIQGSDEQAKN